MRSNPVKLTFLISLIALASLGSVPDAFGQTLKPKRNLQSETRELTSQSPQNGRYFALVIGNNKYRYMHAVATAINDATAVDQLLRERYGFQTQVLLDATRDDIFSIWEVDLR